MSDTEKKIIIIGAGPAGLSAGLNILKNTDYKPIIIEQEDSVGGIAKTYNINDYRTDIGPHRFFTQNKDVFDLWTTLLPLQGKPAADDLLLGRIIEDNEGEADPEKEDNVFLIRKRFSRIYYKKHFIDYPIKIRPQTFFAIGLIKTIQSAFSYFKSCVCKLDETNLESFMINRFGRVLYELFFEGYTQKVWGIHPSELPKEWGEQRIKKISLLGVVIDALLSAINLNKEKETSLIGKYYYPKFGSSQLWNIMAQKIKDSGGEICLNSRVTQLIKEGNKITCVKYVNSVTNEESIFDCDTVISSMPVKDLLAGMNDVPDEIAKLASGLQYRDFILVNFVTDNFKLKNNTKYKTVNNAAPDSWIYLQDKDITAGRLDIMNNFSPYIVKDFQKNFVINLEYFCNENDEFWSMSDDEIIEFAKQELFKIQALDENNIKSSNVFRIKKAYPSYLGSYAEFDKITDFINTIDNLYPIGRNGQHKYNNMDHSVLSGIIVADMIQNNSDKKILWDVNAEKTYQE